MPVADINGWNINYRVTGDGKPVLFIHGGFGGVQGALVPREGMIVPALGDGYRIVEYDRRNTGASGYRDAAYTQDDLAAEAAGLLDHLGIDRAIIIGDSMGGTIAQSFALNFPERVLALALVETSAHMKDAPFYQPLHDLIRLADEQGADAVFERRRNAIYNPQLGAIYERAPEDHRKAMLERLDELKARLAATDESRIREIALGELCNWRAHASYDTRSRLPELGRHRTLVLHGDADSIVPTAHGLELAEGIPKAELALIPGGDHGILMWPAACKALQEWAAGVAVPA